MMQANELAIGAVVLLLILVLLWMWMKRRRRAQLQERFGPEYSQAIREHKDQRVAERVLEARERRVAKFQIRPLTTADASRFAESWRQLQLQFVDDPGGAVTGADRLVAEVMQARGYPLSDFEQRAADISVDHPVVVSSYRAARLISDQHSRGHASTEDLRHALVHYRKLFDELLEASEEPLPRAAGGHR
jgi:hypothetical protein